MSDTPAANAHVQRTFAKPIPDRMRRLPTDHRGFPIPYFVTYRDGKPDFQLIDPRRIVDCHNHRRCWICGQRMGQYFAFVVGPMCAVNRVSADPPSHRECAEFAAVACPFLAHPKATRRPLRQDAGPQPGNMIERNPGVALVWVTKHYRIETVKGGFLFRMGAPTATAWYAETRHATREEVLASIDSGVPELVKACEAEETQANRDAALKQMHGQVEQVKRTLVPAA